MRTACRGLSNPDGPADVEQLHEQLVGELGARPDLVIAYFTEAATEIAIEAIGRLGESESVIAASSCQGVLTQEGLYGASEGASGIAMFGLSDPAGAYGTAFVAFDDDPAADAERAFIDAMANAGRLGELPSLAIVHSTPGFEESVVGAIDRATGGNCAIVGGSAADDAIAGNWTAMASGHGANGVAIAVLYPSTAASTAFQGGYDTTGQSAVVTSGQGRIADELDGRPAAIVYNEWTNGAIDDAFGDDPTVLGQSTLRPLARRVGALDVQGTDVPYYALIHPERVTDDKGLTLFADVHPGDELFLMSGTVDGLISRAGRVVSSARRPGSELAGAIVIYCAGCRLAVDDQLALVVDSIAGAADGAPFIGAFTFGEQGRLLGGENQHGNLMISAGVLDAPKV